MLVEMGESNPNVGGTRSGCTTPDVYVRTNDNLIYIDVGLKSTCNYMIVY